ncbi:hypothetical protein crov410 [Cafeteria roenbergensis virus]|uniref:Uncharacterized protein n=1 Tax=Cafeteria roenbergensis virus (strain BV-PW1) TaxID=693272 RepID=E3T5I1_CROVB|nr:hypothetical protein crov410 [Cafeteria roenbergensis virus BV-PW1]ADO67444.1 hypothetical protein crov410 [Cafeteria roenbergensis virus BV-PW1]
MSINEIKKLIYLIEDKLKLDDRFDKTLRNKMKVVAFTNNSSPVYVPIAVPILDMQKINKLEKENIELTQILNDLSNINVLKDCKSNTDFLKHHLTKLNNIKNNINKIIN